MAAGVDLVVVNYRTASDLSEFLSSIDEHEPCVRWGITVVNVSPRPPDVVVARTWVDSHGPSARYVEMADNVGYGRACNAGAAGGRRPVVALFNADVAVTAGAIDACCGALAARDDWAILGPRQVDQNGRLTHGGIFGTLDHPKIRGWHASGRGGRFTDIRDDAVSVAGSAYFVKRTVWAELTECPVYQAAAPDAEGAFLPTPFCYEETFCSYHARSHGHRCVYFGEVTILHKWHQSVRSNGAEAWARQSYRLAREQFRAACDAHHIAHD